MLLNTRYLSPIALDGITTAPKGSYEWTDWWVEQDKRCREGYSVGDVAITGYHYWYLNFWPIRRKVDGYPGKRLAPPRFLDMDYEFYWEVDRCKKTGKDMLVLKRRQAGFSFKSSSICGHELCFSPDSYTILTSGVEEFSKTTMAMVRTGLSQVAHTEFYKNRIIDNSDMIHTGYEVVEDGRKSVQGYNSILHRITSATPQALVSKSGSTVVYEEVGKFKGIKATKAYTDPGMRSQGQKTGFQLLIGTGGEENESINEVTDMMYAPETYGLMEYDNTHSDEEMLGLEPRKGANKVAYFVPAWKFRVIDEDGNSLKEESLKEIMADRAKVAGDKQRSLQEITQYPLTIEEALLVPDGNVFDVRLLREVKIMILKDHEMSNAVRLGEIDWIYSNGLRNGAEWRDDPHGRYRMTEAPYRQGVDPDGTGGVVPADLYVGSTDSYDRDKTVSVNGSFGCSKIMKLMNKDLSDLTFDLPVCSLIERPDTSAEFYENTAKMHVLYGNAKNLIEYSNLLIFKWYLDNGFEYLLKERPDLATANTINTQVANRYGIDPSTKQFWIQFAADWLSHKDGRGMQNAFKLRDLQLIDRLIRYKRDPNYNCDETIAFALLILHRNDIMNRYMIRTEEVVESEAFMPRYSIQGGRMRRL